MPGKTADLAKFAYSLSFVFEIHAFGSSVSLTCAPAFSRTASHHLGKGVGFTIDRGQAGEQNAQGQMPARSFPG